MAAAFDDTAFLEYQYLVRHAYRREPMRNDDGDAIARQLAKMLEHFRFSPRVDGRGRLIEDQDVRLVAHEGAGQGDVLPLTARPLAAILEPLAQLGVIARGQVLHEFRRQTLSRGAAPALLIVEGAYVARTDIFADHHLVASEVLEDDADAPAQRGLIPLLQIEPIQEDSSPGGLVQAGEQLDQGGLARAVLPDQGEALPGPHVQIDVRQRRSGRAGIDELDVLEADAVAGTGTPLRIPAAAADRLFQIFVEIRQIEIVFVQAAHRRQSG